MLRSATFAFSLPWSATLAQLWLILGFQNLFGADNLPLGKFWGKLEPLSAHNLSFPKFCSCLSKIATSCLPTFSLSMPLTRVARLMTLQCIIAYSIAYHCHEQSICFQRYLTFALHWAYIILMNVVLLFVVKICQSTKVQK